MNIDGWKYKKTKETRGNYYEPPSVFSETKRFFVIENVLAVDEDGVERYVHIGIPSNNVEFDLGEISPSYESGDKVLYNIFLEDDLDKNSFAEVKD